MSDMNETPSVYLVSKMAGKNLFVTASLEAAKREALALLVPPFQINGEWVEVVGSDRFYLEYEDASSLDARPSYFTITKVPVKPSAPDLFTLTTSAAEGVYLFATLASAVSVARRSPKSADAAIAVIERLRDNVLASLIARGFVTPE